jgi:1-deoxy-D-xylulose-5-phosphate synthase
MGICPRVGGVASYLDKARVAPFYNGLKRDVSWLLNKVPVVGEPVEHMLGQFKDALKTFFHGGMLFEEMGFRYIGPVDGHDIQLLRRYLTMIKDVKGPVLLHVFTDKGHGFEPAQKDPVKFHTPAPFCRDENNEIVPVNSDRSIAYTNVVADAVHSVMQQNESVCVLTAAMCAGNKLNRIRDDFPERFFDTGICESHAVAFAGGMAKSGARPIVSIYSTFLQRSFDQIFQEVALQKLPVVFCMDRAGLCGPDGPTHHGVFDNSFMRIFPNMVVMAPGDELDIQPMLDFALTLDAPSSLRYPKTDIEKINRSVAPLELGKSEVLSWGTDGNVLACGALLPRAVEAAEQLKQNGIDIGVVNARFVKPVDEDIVRRAIENGFVITIEENAVNGGFGSAVLEAASRLGLSTDRVRVLGIPDEFIEHGDRSELLTDLGLDASGLVNTARQLAESSAISESAGAV